MTPLVPSDDHEGIAVFALTRRGAALATRIAHLLGTELWLPERLAGEPESPSVVAPPVYSVGGVSPETAGAGIATDRNLVGRGAVWATAAPPQAGFSVNCFVSVAPALRDAFARVEAVVCVMAAGVVVRALAPVLRGKHEDPAVLVLDEGGRFVIPLLSGHVGGANTLAERLAHELGAIPVLTTSSDVQGLLGPDLLAQALDASVIDPDRMVAVAGTLVNGEGLEIWFDPAEVGAAAAYLAALPGYRAREVDAGEGAIPVVPPALAAPALVVTARAWGRAFRDAGFVWLLPRWVIAGVGCKRGTPVAAIIEAVSEALDAAGIHPAALRGLASVVAKADEPGLQEAAEELGVSFAIAMDDDVELQIAAHSLAESAWVRDHIGVGAACEPAALWAAGPGARLVLPKRAANGVTVALAMAEGGDVIARSTVTGSHPAVDDRRFP